MPYMVHKNDSGEHCVYKRGDDGEPTGSPLGCHASAEEAGDQIGAIEAEEKKELARRTRQLAEKVGKVLNAANAQDIVDAFNKLAGVLERAGVVEVAAGEEGEEEAPVEEGEPTAEEEVPAEEAQPMMDEEGNPGHDYADGEAQSAPVGRPSPSAKEDEDEEETVPPRRKMMAVRPTQAEVGYVTLSTTEGKACANCRWFTGASEYGPYCHLIETYPLDILPTGYCNRHEDIPEPMEMAMPMEVANATPKTAYIAPDSNAENVLRSIVAKFQKGLKPGQTVLKAADGTRYMLVVTSNSYQDRENETITTDALKRDVDRAWKAADKFHSNNPLLFWHDERVKVGDIVWADVRGPFYCELAKEAANPLARAVFDYREAHPDEKWGASHRFAYYPAQKDSEKTYHRIYKRETSILPREAAANALTFSGVIPMSDARGDYLNKMLGIENAAALLDQGIETLVAELDKRGVTHKSERSPGTVDKGSEAVKGANELLVALIDAQAGLDQRVQDVTEKNKALESENATLVSTLKTLQERVDALDTQLKGRPRMASRASETEIEKDALPDGVKNAMVTKHPFFKVPVKE